MFEFIKNLFKRSEDKVNPNVDRIDISRVKVDRAKVNRVEVKKFEPKRFEPKTFEAKPYDPNRLTKIRYVDTGEIVVRPFEAAMRDVLENVRPVEIIGYVR